MLFLKAVVSSFVGRIMFYILVFVSLFGLYYIIHSRHKCVVWTMVLTASSDHVAGIDSR